MNAALLPIGKNKFQKVLAEEVIYCEASTGCTNIHLLNGRKFMVYRTLSFVELQLQVPYIVRISRSYLLNLNHVVGVQTGCDYPHIIVKSVVHNSPAHMANLLVGDTLQQINGIAADSILTGDFCADTELLNSYGRYSQLALRVKDNNIELKATTY